MNKGIIFESFSAVLIFTVSVCICSPDGHGGGGGQDGYLYPKPSLAFGYPPSSGHAQPNPTTSTSLLPKCPGIPKANAKSRPQSRYTRDYGNPPIVKKMCRIGEEVFNIDDITVDMDTCPVACKRTPVPHWCPDNCKRRQEPDFCPDPHTCKRNPDVCPEYCREKTEMCPNQETCRRNPTKCPEYCRPTTTKPSPPKRPVHEDEEEILPGGFRPKPEMCPDREICRRNPSRCPSYCVPTTPKPFTPKKPVHEDEEEILPGGYKPKQPEICPDRETCRRNPARCPENCKEKPEVCPDRETCRRNPSRCPEYCISTTVKPFTPRTPVRENEKVLAQGVNPNNEDEHKISDPFTFGYAVKDQESGNDFSHTAESKDDVITGEYRTLMPDGRTQIVKYTSDWKRGHRVKITYEGQIIPYVYRRAA